jgi:hypothetical protein
MKPELPCFRENVVCFYMVEELTNLMSQIKTAYRYNEGSYLPSFFTEPFSVDATVPAAIVRNLAGDTPGATPA